MSSLSLIMFSGDYDRAMAAFTIANGAAGEGQQVSIFFTFWGVGLLRRSSGPAPQPLQRAFKRLMPKGPNRTPLSRFNFAGMGPVLLRRLIRNRRGQTLADLMEMAVSRGVQMIACEASLSLLGIERSELAPWQVLRVGDVHDFLAAARSADVCLFV